MTYEQDKNQGLRALALGMPWKNGLMDGWALERIGDSVLCDDCGGDYKKEHHALLGHSFPDLRDPVTESYFISFAMKTFAESNQTNNVKRFISEEYKDGVWYVIVFSNNKEFTLGEGLTRVEAWLRFLEVLRA